MTNILSLNPKLDTLAWIKTLSDHLAKFRFNFSNEKELQAGIAKAFAKLEGECLAEHRLSDQDIPDFYWPAKKVAVEVKIDHSLSMLTRQLHRYAQHETISGILLVTSKPRLTNLPEDINRKPVRCHSIIGSLL